MKKPRTRREVLLNGAVRSVLTFLLVGIGVGGSQAREKRGRMNCSFLLFAGLDYYPGGGAIDFVGAFDTLEQAKEAYDPDPYGWGQIAQWDGSRLTIVSENDRFYKEGTAYSGSSRQWVDRRRLSSPTRETRR